jgi:hypothetical protein
MERQVVRTKPHVQVLREHLIAEIEELSPADLEKFYYLVIAVKDIFIEADEARYYTETWQEAEREATEAHQRGGLPAFDTVDELMDYIEAGVERE